MPLVRKYLLLSRSSSNASSLHQLNATQLAEHYGLSANQCLLRHASDCSSKSAFQALLVDFEASVASCLVFVCPARLKLDLALIVHLIDECSQRFETQRKEKLFVVLLHLPLERLWSSRSQLAPAFMSGWNSFYCEIAATTEAHLLTRIMLACAPGIAQPQARLHLAQEPAGTAGEDRSKVQQAVRLGPVLEFLSHQFLSKVSGLARSQAQLPRALNASLHPFYLSTCDNHPRSLIDLLQRKQCLQQHLEDSFFAWFQPLGLQKRILQFAEKVASQQSVEGLCVLASRFCLNAMAAYFGPYMAALMRNFGLSMFFDETFLDTDVVLLLDFLPRPSFRPEHADAALANQHVFVIPSTVSPTLPAFQARTPLFQLLHNDIETRLQAVLKAGPAPDVDRLINDLEVSMREDSRWARILDAGELRAKLVPLYESDMLAQLAEGLTTRPRFAATQSVLIPFLVRYLRRGDAEQTASLASIHARIHHEQDNLKSLIFGVLALFDLVGKVEGLGEQLNSMETHSDFIEGLPILMIEKSWSALEQAVQALAAAPDDAQIDRTAFHRWSSSFHFIVQCFPAERARGMQSARKEELIRRVAAMKVMFALLQTPGLLRQSLQVVSQLVAAGADEADALSLQWMLRAFEAIHAAAGQAIDDNTLQLLQQLLLELIELFLDTATTETITASSATLLLLLNQTGLPHGIQIPTHWASKLFHRCVQLRVGSGRDRLRGMATLEREIDAVLKDAFPVARTADDFLYFGPEFAGKHQRMHAVYRSPLAQVYLHFRQEELAGQPEDQAHLHGLLMATANRLSPASSVTAVMSNFACVRRYLAVLASRLASMPLADCLSRPNGVFGDALIGDHLVAVAAPNGLLELSHEENLIWFLQSCLASKPRRDFLRLLEASRQTPGPQGAWARELLTHLTVPAESDTALQLRESLPTFLLPVGTRRCPLHRFEHLRPLFEDFSSRFQQSVQSRNAAPLADWCGTFLAANHPELGLLDPAGVVGMFVILKVYYFYFCAANLAALAPLQLVQRLALVPGLQLTEPEWRVVRLFIEPHAVVRHWDQQYDLAKLFNPAVTDEYNISVRDLVVNMLAFVLGSRRQPMFMHTMLFRPLDICDTFTFAATSRRQVQVYHLDCVHQYSEQGRPTGTPSALSDFSLKLSTMSHFAMAGVYAMLFSSDLVGPVLSADYVDTPENGQHPEEQLNTFIIRRILGPFEFIRLGSRNQFTPQQAALFVSRALEEVLHAHLVASPGVLRPVYPSAQDLEQSERLWTGQVTSVKRKLSQASDFFNSLQRRPPLLVKIEDTSHPTSFVPHLSWDQEPLAAIGTQHADPSCVLLRKILFVSQSVGDGDEKALAPGRFELAKCVPAIVRLHDALHRCLSGRVPEAGVHKSLREIESAFDLASQHFVIEEGIVACNKAIDMIGGLYAGACRAGQEALGRVGMDTPLAALINVGGDFVEGNLLFKLLDQAVRQQQDLLVACSDLLPELEAAAPELHDLLSGCPFITTAGEVELGVMPHGGLDTAGLLTVTEDELLDLCNAYAGDFRRIQAAFIKRYLVKVFHLSLRQIKSRRFVLAADPAGVSTAPQASASSASLHLEIEPLSANLPNRLRTSSLSQAALAVLSASLQAMITEDMLLILHDLAVSSDTLALRMSAAFDAEDQGPGDRLVEPACPLVVIFRELQIPASLPAQNLLQLRHDDQLVLRVGTLWHSHAHILSILDSSHSAASVPPFLRHSLPDNLEPMLAAFMDSRISACKAYPEAAALSGKLLDVLAELERSTDSVARHADNLLARTLRVHSAAPPLFEEFLADEMETVMRGRHLGSLMNFFLGSLRQIRQVLIGFLRGTKTVFVEDRHLDGDAHQHLATAETFETFGEEHDLEQPSLLENAQDDTDPAAQENEPTAHGEADDPESTELYAQTSEDGQQLDADSSSGNPRAEYQLVQQRSPWRAEQVDVLVSWRVQQPHSSRLCGVEPAEHESLQGATCVLYLTERLQLPSDLPKSAMLQTACSLLGKDSRWHVLVDSEGRSLEQHKASTWPGGVLRLIPRRHLVPAVVQCLSFQGGNAVLSDFVQVPIAQGSLAQTVIGLALAELHARELWKQQVPDMDHFFAFESAPDANLLATPLRLEEPVTFTRGRPCCCLVFGFHSALRVIVEPKQAPASSSAQAKQSRVDLLHFNEENIIQEMDQLIGQQFAGFGSLVRTTDVAKQIHVEGVSHDQAGYSVPSSLFNLTLVIEGRPARLLVHQHAAFSHCVAAALHQSDLSLASNYELSFTHQPEAGVAPAPARQVRQHVLSVRECGADVRMRFGLSSISCKLGERRESFIRTPFSVELIDGWKEVCFRPWGCPQEASLRRFVPTTTTFGQLFAQLPLEWPSFAHGPTDFWFLVLSDAVILKLSEASAVSAFALPLVVCCGSSAEL
eukprot:m.915115 g.915115  ORF g.915115 m.915115 type:complete len:2413 (+) comp60149_c0_seq1:3223-10461(+)